MRTHARSNFAFGTPCVGGWERITARSTSTIHGREENLLSPPPESSASFSSASPRQPLGGSRVLTPAAAAAPTPASDLLGYPRSVVSGVQEAKKVKLLLLNLRPKKTELCPPLLPPDHVPVIMFGRGSQRVNLMKASAVQRKPSPKISSTQKREPSPKVDHSRASWNAGLEKALIDLLHEHNNECYRGQNGWSTEAWNKIVKLFHEKFPYVRFTKVQIQDKDRELKRDYRVLKEARKQSGARWNEKLCMIEGDEAVWNNIISSHPKAKKFRNKSFPLFESLGELYDGQTAAGTLNFTSIAPSRVPVTQPSSQIPVTQPSSQVPVTQPYIGEETEKGPFDPSGHALEDDDEVRIVDQPTTSSSLDKREERLATSRNKNPSVSSDKVEREGFKRRQDGKVVEMMGRFLELKEKQVEAESVRQKRARTNAHEDEFPIPMCIAVVGNMEDLSDDEKIEASDVFKDPQNRAIFMTAKDSTRLKWLRKKIRTA